VRKSVTCSAKQLSAISSTTCRFRTQAASACASSRPVAVDQVVRIHDVPLLPPAEILRHSRVAAATSTTVTKYSPATINQMTDHRSTYPSW